MTSPLSTKQIAAVETIAAYTKQQDVAVEVNFNSLMGSIETSNLASTKSVVSALQVKGLLKIVKGELKDESVTIFLTKEGAEFISGKQTIKVSAEQLEKVIAGEETTPIEPIVVLAKKAKEPKAAKEKVEHKDAEGNYCPKKGEDEGGSKSWNIYEFLRIKDDKGLAPINRIVRERMVALNLFHKTYDSEIDRVRSNYNIILKD